MSTPKLRTVDMVVLNMFKYANRITIEDGVGRGPGVCISLAWIGDGRGRELPEPIIKV